MEGFVHEKRDEPASVMIAPRVVFIHTTPTLVTVIYHRVENSQSSCASVTVTVSKKRRSLEAIVTN